MLYPIKLVDIELSHAIPAIEGLENYKGVQVLVRLHRMPIGYVHVAVSNGSVDIQSLCYEITQKHSQKIIHHLLQNGLRAFDNIGKLSLEDLFDVPPLEDINEWPLVTVAVCTRDRTSDLALCLSAIGQLEYTKLEVIVIDNAPSSKETEYLLTQQFPHIRYVCEPRPGLDWARNRAIIEARGEFIAFTDDDVIVDPTWVKALATTFIKNPQVMALTGLVVPYELETASQVLFEEYGGFGRGFERIFWHIPGKKLPWQRMGAGQYGTGANMAFRKSVFNTIGLFDPALDVGTVTNGGGDMEMFFRVLKEGYTLVYEPNAMVRHRHRRQMNKLYDQIANNGIGLYAFWVRCAMHYPNERLTLLRIGIWWFWWWNLRRALKSYLLPVAFPRSIILAELKGCFKGLRRYQKAKIYSMKIDSSVSCYLQKGQEQSNLHIPETLKLPAKRKEGIAIRTIDMDQPLQPLEDVGEYAFVRIFVKKGRQLIGSMELSHGGTVISREHLVQMLVKQFGNSFFFPYKQTDTLVVKKRCMDSLLQRNQHALRKRASSTELPASIQVSIIVATYDRPQDLRNLLQCLQTQKTQRPVEVIVVDNNPASGITGPVVKEFSGVKLIEERRKGLSYARNTGFLASRGSICVATDDDVTMPEDWLERLVAPFVRTDIGVVTGNVLPMELETRSQQLFETYGGLGKGFVSKEAGRKWFDAFRKAVPTWDLGATANAAFRKEIFFSPAIGLLNETLGAGTPTGCSEDTYLFYKVLKAGYTIYYNADAFVWHRHRNTTASLRKQLYNYSKGHVAYNLTTWLSDGDWRGLHRVLVEVPYMFLKRIKTTITGRSNYPLSLLLLEMGGHLAGPWSLYRSYLRVKKIGRSKVP